MIFKMMKNLIRKIVLWAFKDSSRIEFKINGRDLMASLTRDHATR